MNIIKKIAALIIAILVIILIEKLDIGIPCILYKFTGLYCPTCGITRAIKALIHLDIYKAFRYNMLIVILIPFIGIYLIYKLVYKGTWKVPNYIWGLLILVAILFGILRNIPYSSFLAPINV